MVSSLRMAAVIAALCAPAAAFAAFVASWGGGFEPDMVRLLWADELLPQLALSLLPVAPAAIWLALAAGKHDAPAHRPGRAITALTLAPLALVLAWFIFALAFLALFYISKSYEAALSWTWGLSVTEEAALIAAALGFGLFAGLYALSLGAGGSGRLRRWALLIPCILAPAGLMGFWPGLHGLLPVTGPDPLLFAEFEHSDLCGHVAPVLRRYAYYVLYAWMYDAWEHPGFYLGLVQLIAVLLLAVLPVVLALNVLRHPERRQRALAAALVIAWVVHLPSEFAVVLAAWDEWKPGEPEYLLSYAAGPLIRLLAVTGAVALAIRRTAVK